MNESQETQNRLSVQNNAFSRLLKPPALYGVCAVVLLGVASFLFMGAYAQNTEPIVPQAASAAGATRAFGAVALTGKAAIVVDIATGETLYEHSADAQLPLASLAKVPLALVVSEVLDPDSTITIPYDTAMTIGGQRLRAGQTWRVQDVVNFTLIASSNEGAQILATAAGSNIRAQYPDAPQSGTPSAATLWRMNRLATEKGFTGMYFLNVSGLDESTTLSGAYGTARSVAKLFAYAAATSPNMFAGTTKNGLLMDDSEGNITAAFNTNESLNSIPGLIMGKTGLTDLAGGNLAVVFDVGLAHPVVAVVLGSSREGRFSDMELLVSAARTAIIGQ